MLRSHPWLASLPLLLGAASAAGQDVTLDPVARGTYTLRTSNGTEFSIVQPYNNAFINSYVIGFDPATADNQNIRGLFVYDLPAAPAGQVAAAATLRLSVPGGGIDGVTGGPHEVTIHRVDATIAELEASAASFSDLGAGAPYAGPVTLTDADEGTFVDFPLDAGGLAALNAALGGQWALSSRSDREDALDIKRVAFQQSGSIGNLADGNSQLLITWGDDGGNPNEVVLRSAHRGRVTVLPDGTEVFTGDYPCSGSIDANYTTGRISNATGTEQVVSRGYFVYDLPTPPPGTQLVGAEFRIYDGPTAPAGVEGLGIVSIHPGPDPMLLETCQAAFADLGQGDTYAARVYDGTVDNDGSTEALPLTPDGLAYLQARLGQQVAFSARHSADEIPGPDGYVWGYTNSDLPDDLSNLVLTFAPIPPISCSYPLIAGGGSAQGAQTVGSLSVTYDPDAMLWAVTYQTEGAWWIAATHLAAACDLSGFPMTRRGNPIPGLFPYSDSTYGQTVTFHVPDLMCGGGMPTYFAAHAVVVDMLSGDVETAWAGGDGLEFPGKNWATYVDSVCD